MSKQSEAKKIQNYRKHPSSCSNCKFYQSSLIENQYGWIDEKRKTCTLGGFSVQKTAVCDKHELNVAV